VLRLTAGARIRVFNGRGEEWDAILEEATKQRVSVNIVRRVTSLAEARVPMTLCMAVLKGHKMDDIVRDAVMLGVSRIRPIVTERTESAPGVIARSGRVARWQRIAVSSTKQCGRAVVPDVSAVVTLDEALRSEPHPVMLVEPAIADGAVMIKDLPQVPRAGLFVGPEGGWTARELQLARESGAMLLTLGTLTLRADAVPLVAITACRVHLEDF
jgi:16S rRNA (uracil1498-N3)-methyltransferase